jgi:hypothetical protein
MKISTIAAAWRIKALVAATLLVSLGSSPLTLQAQVIPDGSWDVVLSGSQRGLAQITFYPDFTLDGVEAITFKRKSASSSSSNNSRGGDNDSRGDTGGTVSTASSTNYYGMASLTGSWTYDNRQRIIGFISEVDGTNVVNGISFRAVVRADRITINGVGNGARTTYRGVRLNALPDISGDYYGQGKSGGNSFNEVLTLVPNGDPNTYDATGVGPAYDYIGIVMVSAKKQMAFVSLLDDGAGNTRLRSVTGSHNLSKGIAKLTGLIENGDSVTNANVKLVKQP